MSETLPEKDKRDLMLMAVIQAQDAEVAVSALARLGFTVVRLPSVGGFLGRRNATLLIGLPEDRREEAIASLNKTAASASNISPYRSKALPYRCRRRPPSPSAERRFFPWKLTITRSSSHENDHRYPA